ncbi:MAG: hypothetical protein ABIO63_09285 [Casimicrobiaceae bacterium]
MTYKQWVSNEYKLWIQALYSSALYNFKDHPQVKRMLSLDMTWIGPIPKADMKLMEKIDNIGYSIPTGISGSALRMMYYADKILKINPRSIVEIGGGVGQFYAVLRAMGYQGDYWIYDLPEVKEFQYHYLFEVSRRTGLSFVQKENTDFCVSFYALGEFDDETKSYYIDNVVRKCPHGYVVWNPHSGATEDIEFPCNITLQKDGSKLLTW